MLKLPLVVTSLALVACGDGTSSSNPPDAPGQDVDAPAPDAPEQPFVTPTPFSIPLSSAGPDQLQSACAAPGGGFYAAGFAAATSSGDRKLVIVKLTTAGLDVSFGTGGVVTTDVVFKGGSDEIDVMTQTDGKLLISTTIANANDAADRDVAVIRLLADGTLDPSFGTNGIARLDLGTAHNTGMALTAFDGARAIAADDLGIYVHAVSRAPGTVNGGGPRTDTDFVVVKLTSAGVLDATFGTAGVFRLDIQNANATPRFVKVLGDGSLLAGGYASTPGVGAGAQPVLFKLSPSGALDTNWSTGGVFHEAVLATQTEVYNIAIHGAKFVTAGYGRESGDANQYISLRFDVATGARDATWGPTNGAIVFDPSGTGLSSNARNAIALPNGRTALIGSTGPSNMPAQDAVVAILDGNGAFDQKFGDGIHTYALGADGNDQFWGGAVSGENALFVGYHGGGATPSDTNNDDAYGVIYPMAQQ